MANIIYLKIDVTKIDKARLFQGKNGAQYLDAVLIPSQNSKYGDSHMIVQGVTKEEREAGKRGPIIGNAKTPERKQEHTSPPSRASTPAPREQLDEDVPF